MLQERSANLLNAIFTELNRGFLPYAKLFFESLQRNYPNHPDVFVYHADLTPEEIKKLTAYPRVKPVLFSCKNLEFGPPMASHHPHYADPRISYARFHIWDDTFNSYDKVLHLDTDILVMRPLDELFQREEFTIFAETYQGDDAMFYELKNPELTALLNEDGIGPFTCVGNAGVFLAPRNCRSKEDKDLLFYFLKRYKNFIKWSDQSVLNLWMARKGFKPSEGHTFNFLHPLLQKSSEAKQVSQSHIFHLNGVDLAYRLTFMRMANKSYRIPGGWMIYRSFYNAASGSLKFWRSTKKSLAM